MSRSRKLARAGVLAALAVVVPAVAVAGPAQDFNHSRGAASNREASDARGERVAEIVNRAI